MEEGGAKKLPLVLDWEKLLPSHDDGVPPPLLVVIPNSQPPKSSPMDSDQSHSQREEGFDLLSDHDLNESIRSKRRTLETMAPKLHDKGQKIRATLKRLEDEMERRKLRRLNKVFSFSLFFPWIFIFSLVFYSSVWLPTRRARRKGK